MPSLDTIRTRNVSTHWHPHGYGGSDAVAVSVPSSVSAASSADAPPFVSPIKVRRAKPDVGKPVVVDEETSRSWGDRVQHRAPQSLKSENLHANWTLDGSSPPPPPPPPPAAVVVRSRAASDVSGDGAGPASAAAAPVFVDDIADTAVASDGGDAPLAAVAAASPAPPAASAPAPKHSFADPAAGVRIRATPEDVVFARPSVAWYDTTHTVASPRRPSSSITKPDQGYSPEFAEAPKTARYAARTCSAMCASLSLT